MPAIALVLYIGSKTQECMTNQVALSENRFFVDICTDKIRWELQRPLKAASWSKRPPCSLAPVTALAPYIRPGRNSPPCPQSLWFYAYVKDVKKLDA
jgi:hypothetical protein